MGYAPLGDLSSKRVLFRLQVKDFNASLVCFLMAHFILKRMELAPFALVVPLLVLVVLGGIRDRYRSHIIRDTITALYHRGRIYVSVYTRS